MLSSTLWMLCGQARSSCRDTEFCVTSLARAREGDVTDGTNLCGERILGSHARKIEVRELAEKPPGSGVVSESGLYFRVKSTEMDKRIVYADACAVAPLAIAIGALYGLPSYRATVASIAAGVALAEVSALTIEPVAVSMINDDAWRRPKNESMEPDHHTTRFFADPAATAGIDDGVLANSGQPRECTDALEIFVINKRDETLGQRNLTRHGAFFPFGFVRLEVERLAKKIERCGPGSIPAGGTRRRQCVGNSPPPDGPTWIG